MLPQISVTDRCFSSSFMNEPKLEQCNALRPSPQFPGTKRNMLYQIRPVVEIELLIIRLDFYYLPLIYLHLSNMIQGCLIRDEVSSLAG